jgi:hypothetical protein
MPMPQVSTYSTTLGAAAGAAGSGARRASSGRTPFVLGGIVVAGALAGVVIVLATAGSGSQKQQQGSGDTIASGSQAVDASIANVVEPDAPAPVVDAEVVAAVPEIDAAVSAPSGKRSDIEFECLRYQNDQKWSDLDACADRLMASNPTLAKDHKNRAVQEVRSRPRINAAEAALQEKNLKKAKAELDQVWPGSGSYKRLKDRYDAVENATIAEVVARLNRAAGGDCKEYNAILAQERTTKLPRVAAEAAKQVRCTPQSSPPLATCDVDQLLEKARDLYASGMYTQALATYEAALACRADQPTYQKAFASACHLRNLPKAKQYWRKLSRSSQQGVNTICVLNGITEDELNAP